MRVVLVSHRYPPDAVAGVERYTEALAGGLAAAGDAVAVVSRRPGPEPRPRVLREEPSADGITVYRLAGGDSPRERPLAHHGRLDLLFGTVLTEFAPDVVHFNHLIDLSPGFIEVAHRHRAAAVLTLHDFFVACPRIILRKDTGELCRGPRGGRECAETCFAGVPGAGLELGLRTAYFRRLLSLPEFVLCPSKYVADYFQAFAGGARDGRTPVRAVPNGIRVERAAPSPGEKPTPADRGCLNLAFLGSVVPHKGIHVILDAVELAGLPAVRLDVLGPGDPHYAKDLRERGSTIPGLTLDFRGAYEPAELAGLLADVDCVIAPSQWPETFLLVTREAMAHGVPIIVTRLGALPDAVSEGVNGLTFDHDRPDQLAAQLKRLAEDADLLRRLRRGAAETPVHTMAEHVCVIRTIYRQAMEDLAGRHDAARGGDDELAFMHSALLGVGAGEVAV